MLGTGYYSKSCPNFVARFFGAQVGTAECPCKIPDQILLYKEIYKNEK